MAAFLSCSDTKEKQGCWFPGLYFLPEHYVTVSIVLLLWDSHGCERDTMTLHFVCVSATFEWHLAKYLFPKKIFPSLKAGCTLFFLLSSDALFMHSFRQGHGTSSATSCTGLTSTRWCHPHAIVGMSLNRTVVLLETLHCVNVCENMRTCEYTMLQKERHHWSITCLSLY